MSDADKAFDAARTEILRVKEAGEGRLDLSGQHLCVKEAGEGRLDLSGQHLRIRRFEDTQYRALERIPEEITNLKTLQTLNLNQTQVSNIAPLSGLTALQRLTLNQTQVSDIAPLAGLTALQTLFLNQTQVSDIAPLSGLTALQALYLVETQVSDIAPLSGLTALQRLSLNQTQVSHIAPLAGLTALQTLWLHQTQVSDLRPICDLPDLGNGPFGGLWFGGIPALQQDPELARLSEIKDTTQRTNDTQAYLRTLTRYPAPLAWEATEEPTVQEPETVPPEQDPGLPLVWGEEGFAFFAKQVQSDPVTDAALEDLRDLLNDLKRKGNRHDDLYRLVEELQARSAGEVFDLNMVKLHMSHQKLRRLYEGRERRSEAFDDETVTALASVLEIVPGVTLSDEGVRILIERQETEKARAHSEEETQAADQVLDDIQQDNAPFAPEVKDIARVIRASDAEDRLSGTRSILSRNTVIAVLGFLGSAAIGGWVGNFAWAYADDLLAYAMTMGDDAFVWAQSVMTKFKAEYEIAMGIAKEIGGKPVKKPKD